MYSNRRFPNRKLIEELIQRNGNKCSVCGATNVPLEIHHIIPLSQGGDNSLNNFILVCPNCHSSQGGQVRHFEFQYYLIELLNLNDNFRNVTDNFPLSRVPRLQADISAEERVDGKWQHIIIECKTATTWLRPITGGNSI